MTDLVQVVYIEAPIKYRVQAHDSIRMVWVIVQLGLGIHPQENYEKMLVKASMRRVSEKFPALARFRAT
jgi:hypothetical protein